MRPEPGSWQHDIVELLATLKRYRVPFLVAGGYAVARAGHLRATRDVDIFVPRVSGVTARLVRALEDFLGEPISVELANRRFMRFFVGRPGAFDIIRELPGVRWATAWKGRTRGKLFGASVPFLGIDALIRNKRAVGRHIDLADVEQLEQIRLAARSR